MSVAYFPHLLHARFEQTVSLGATFSVVLCYPISEGASVVLMTPAWGKKHTQSQVPVPLHPYLAYGIVGFVHVIGE